LQILSLGKHNPRLVQIRKAIQKGELTSTGLLPVEGPKLLQEAARSGLAITEIFIQRGGRSGRSTFDPRSIANAAVYELEPEVFKTIQATEHSQGIIALVRPTAFSLNHIVSLTNPRLVVLARLQDPGNVGTILRIAESFFATGCIALAGTVDVHNSKTVRASAGSVFRLPHVWSVGLEELCRVLKKAGMALVGTSPAASQSIQEWPWHRPTAVMIGNEGAGLSGEEKERCDCVLRIPHNPAVESLNSAIAAAVTLYEASKHERKSV